MKNFWKNKKVFITGHTGFKGSWLSIFLHHLGAKITGYSLPATKKSLYNMANLKKIFTKSYSADVRDFKKLYSAMKDSKTDIVFHLAAQPLVLESYKNPLETFQTNMIGTLNLIEAVRKLQYIKSAMIITTDKVYDTKKNKVFKETDLLGGSDPYSMSKVCCELISKSYSESFEVFNKRILTTARAGNVIGGGDYSKDRIIPDIYKSYNTKKKLLIRNPNHVRPWQHVLEPLYGYLILAEKTYKKKLPLNMENWNFAPNINDCKSVLYVVNKFKKKINFKTKLIRQKRRKKETKILKLDSFKSKKHLNWKPKWSLSETINKIVEWNNLIKTKKPLDVCKIQIMEYLKK